MTNTRVPKILIGVTLVAAALGYLVYSATRTNLVYYYELDEVQGAVPPDRELRIAGDVVAGTIVKSPGDPRMTFQIEGPRGTTRVPVVYAGAVPDIFRPGIQVVVEGKFSEGGTFEASRLTAKCPSKYQAAGDLDPRAPKPSRPTASL